MDIKKNKDIIFLIVVAIVLVLDFMTTIEVIEALGFVLITLVFIYSVFVDKNFLKDERITYIKLFSGYISFMISIMIVCGVMASIRYFGISMNTSDILRYITLLMYLTFSVTYAITKRKQ